MSILLTTTEAASYLGVSPSLLEGWRSRQKGPSFYRLSRKIIRYRKSDLDQYLETTATKNEVNWF